MAQLMLLPLNISCSTKIHAGFTFVVPAHPVVPDKGPLNGCLSVLFVPVCRGKSSDLAHHKNIDATYRQYQTDLAGCTYIDGNIEIVFLTNQTNYDLSFLKVLLLSFIYSFIHYHQAQLPSML